MLRAHCPALGRCFSSIWRRCYFWGYSHLAPRDQTQIQRSQGSFFILYTIKVSQRTEYIIRLPPPSPKFATTLSHPRLCSLHPLLVSLLCLRKFPRAEHSLLRSESRSMLLSLSPPPPPAAAAWANYHALEALPQPSVLNKRLDRNLMGDSSHLHISLFSRHMLYTHSWLAISHRQQERQIYVSTSQHIAYSIRYRSATRFFPIWARFFLNWHHVSRNLTPRIKTYPIPTIVPGSLSSPIPLTSHFLIYTLWHLLILVLNPFIQF